MSELAEKQNGLGVTFEYPVVGGNTLYGLMDILNEKFNLQLTKEEYVNTEAHIGLDGYITLAAINSSGVPVMSFKNTTDTTSKVISKRVTPSFPLLKNMSSFVNFPEEFDFLTGLTEGEQSVYDHSTQAIYRKLKLLLIMYGFGNYPIIRDGKGPAISGMRLVYMGSGIGAPKDGPVLKNYPFVVIIDLPKEDGFERIIMKTERSL